MTADQFNLFALPKPALALVLGALAREDRERLQLVCRSWAKKFATEPLLSAQLAVHVRKLDSCPKNKWQRKLAARGHHTEELTLYTSSKAAQQHGSAYGGAYGEDDYGEEEYDSEEGEVHNPKAAALHRKLLACFKDGRLRRLTVVGCLAHSALSSQLAAFGSLRHLELRHTAAEEGCCGLHDSCLARQLLDRVEEEQLLPPGLQSLSLRLPQLPHPPLLLEDLADFSALTALELGGVSTVDDIDDPTEDLACLTSLRRLVLRAEILGSDCSGGFVTATCGELYLGTPESGGEFPLTGLTRLTSLVLTGNTHAHPGLGRPLNSASGFVGARPPAQARIGIGEGVAQLPQLQELHMDGLVDAVPADLWQCSALTHLVIRGTPSADPSYDEDERLLPELPPVDGARLPHLRTLCLRGCATPPGLLGQLLAATPQLTALALGDLEFWGGDGGDGSAELVKELKQLAKLTALQELDLSTLEIFQEDWDQLLPSLTPLKRLRILRLADCQLTSLPKKGPYQSLEELDLSDNFLVEVPAWLPRACPRLRVLDVGFCGEEQGSYEDPSPLALTPAVRELATRSSSARLQKLTIPATRYFGRAGRYAELEPRQKTARAVFEELLALSNAGRMVLKVADERFPEELAQPLHESWL